jgi:hypothetical protein
MIGFVYARTDPAQGLPRGGKPVIERVTFIATRSGAYRSPLTDAFRAALRRAVVGVSDPVLPLEDFEPQQAIAAR